MEVILKSELFNTEVSEHDKSINSYEYVAGYITNHPRIQTNTDFLDTYRYVQFYEFPITDEMKRYARNPNYSPKSLIEQMLLTGDDKYFREVKALIEDPNNSYTPSLSSVIEEQDNIYTHIVEEDRADLASKFYELGYPPGDIYCHVSNANACLEVMKTLVSNGFIASDDIIFWYLTKGMGAIADVCFNECTDMQVVVESLPIDTDSFELIETGWSHHFTAEECQTILFNLVTSNSPTDSALLKRIYLRVKDQLIQTEKLDILKKLLNKNERFPIYIYMCLLVKDGFTFGQIEQQVMAARSYNGYIILKVQLEECKDLDGIVDLATDYSGIDQTTYFSEDQNGFISAQNEKYNNSDSSDDDTVISSSASEDENVQRFYGSDDESSW